MISCTTSKGTPGNWRRLKFPYSDSQHCVVTKRGLQSRSLWKPKEKKCEKGEGWSDIKKKVAAGTLEQGREGGGRDAERRRNLRTTVAQKKKKKLLVEKGSKSWTCSYCFSSFNSFFFHLFFFVQMGQNPSVYAFQDSGHVHWHDMVRTFWTEDLVILI